MTYKTYIFIVLTLGSFFSLIAQSERKMTRNGIQTMKQGILLMQRSITKKHWRKILICWKHNLI